MEKSKMNKEWHATHKMPRNATLDQRIAWHLEHYQNCSCRDIPAQIREEIRKRNLKLKK